MQIIKKVIKFPCYSCKPIHTKARHKCTCVVCDGKGNYEETFYYHIITHKGQKYCIDGDTLK